MGNRVGAIVTRSVAGPLSLGAPAGFAPFVVVLAERGPSSVPITITSLDGYRQVFGGALPETGEYGEGYEVLKAFFAKGGRRAVVCRVVGSGATPVTQDLDDQGGTARSTLRLTAKGEGTYLAGKKVKVEAGTRTSTFKLTLLDAADRALETFDNLKVDAPSLERVNNQSNLVTLADLESTNAAPANLPAFATTTLTGGADDNEPDAATIIGTSTNGVKTGMQVFRSLLLGPGFLCAPGLDGDVTVKAEMIAQSELYFRQVYTSSEAGANVATAKTQRAQWDAFNVGFLFPRPKVRDERTKALKSIPAVGHLLADYLRALDRDGQGKAPGGRDFRVDSGVVQMEAQVNGEPLVDELVAEDLVAHGINPIYDKDNTGARVWGARAATSDPAWQYLHASYLWCLIGYTMKTELGRRALDLADALFFNSLQQGMYLFMAGLYQQRAFRGALPGPGETADPEVHAFGVLCDESLLSATDKNNGNVRAKIWYRPSGIAETIFIDLAKQNEVS